jgi:hypothetical protein
MGTTFRGIDLSKIIVWTRFLWITSVYLWISGTRCGELANPFDIQVGWHPHI